MTLNPYLNFPGNTEEALIFYKSVFGGDFSYLQRFQGMEGSDKLPAGDQNKIMHMALPIGNSLLMATDALASMGQKLTFGNNFYIIVDTDTKAQADELFARLSAGGRIEMPIGDASWGAYFGCFADKFGVQWMINFDSSKK
jgi:PhnB protein